MTATPKLYKPAAKTRAANEDLVLYSMDDGSAESMRVFGPVMYRLTFSDAIDMNQLTDYEVIVLGVSEKYGGKKSQKIVNATTDEGDLNITDKARRFLPQDRVIWPRPSVRASSGALSHQNPTCAIYWMQ